MCGIAGILNTNGAPVILHQLKTMTDSIEHRGPDGEGHYLDDYFGLGHRRLSIIDLSSAGYQPMQTEDKRYIISYNGEIYNFQEIKLELQSLGYKFYSKTDTEVVLKGYAKWGAKVLEKLNGMFAFAIWDSVEKKLFMARDRHGIKPLYYIFEKGSFYFGSEIKTFISLQPTFSKLDKDALVEYLTFQNFFSENTLFKNVKILPAGCYLEIGFNISQIPAITRYWDYRFEDSLVETESEIIEKLEFLFEQAVKRQLIADVPIGCYLSGGIDSGAITMLASKQLFNMNTFTVGFDLSSASGLELGFDERAKAEHISYLAKTEQYEMVLKAGDMERCMQELVWHLEEPRVGQSYPNFYASKLASKFGKVVLAGTGGDELFAGYPWRYFRGNNKVKFQEFVDQYYIYWQRIIPNSDMRNVLQPIWADVKHVWTRDIFAKVFDFHLNNVEKPQDYVNHCLYFEAKTFLHGLLVMEDKLSMAHGLEARVPFLDNDLVDYAMKIPTHFKIPKDNSAVRIDENITRQKEFQKRSHGKIILRNLMKKYVPSEITDFQKQGFSAPDASWFKGESVEYVKDLLLNKSAKIYDVLDYKSVHGMVSEHLKGTKNRRLLIWSLIYLETWFSAFKVAA